MRNTDAEIKMQNFKYLKKLFGFGKLHSSKIFYYSFNSNQD